MDPSHRRALRSPIPPASPNRSNAGSRQSGRSSLDYESDTASNYAPPPLTVNKRPAAYSGHTLPNFVSHKNASTASITQVRPSAQYMPRDNDSGSVPPSRKGSALAPSPRLGHRPRQHSQGYFEPNMPSISSQAGHTPSVSSQSGHTPSISSLSGGHTPSTAGLTPSQIAAQAAVQHLNISQHVRRRSSTVPVPELEEKARRDSYGSASSDGKSMSPVAGEYPVHYRNGLMGSTAATTAAQAVWQTKQPPLEEKEKKGLRSRFRPKHIGIIRDKDKEGKDRPMASPIKPTSGLAKVYNASTTSLAETLSSNNSSMYQLPNNSVTTIIASDEKKKHVGLRQKLKLKDKDDNTSSLSSSVSTRPVDINNPQSIYAFAPSSPSHTGTFSKSSTGLNISHGVRALRKGTKKDEKDPDKLGLGLETVYSRTDSDTSEWPSLSNYPSQGSEHPTPYTKELKETLSVFGLNNMTPDDAWEFLKARLLAVFSDEHVPIAVEDLNKLVSIHVQRCVLKRDPSLIIGDLENLLHTGFTSLSHTLRGVNDERLVPNLVDMWMNVFGSILPFMQAVFLPLDQEFKGRGIVLKTPSMAAEFWGALPSPESIGRLSSSPSSAPEDSRDEVVAGEELEVRRMLLMSFRDHVILTRFELLKATFSRLSLESINATLAHFESSSRSRGDSLGRDSFESSHHNNRPGTSHDNNNPKISSSYSSQTSTLLGGQTPGSRSRATSNLSSQSTGSGSGSASDVAFQSFSSPPPPRHQQPDTSTSSAQITETVARMLQCLSVLSSVQSGDESQQKMEELTKELKLNWLGRGRTGRNRRGFVGTKTSRRVNALSGLGMGGIGEEDGSSINGGTGGGNRRSIASTIRAQVLGEGGYRGSREGSPTPTPTRQGTMKVSAPLAVANAAANALVVGNRQSQVVGSEGFGPGPGW